MDVLIQRTFTLFSVDMNILIPIMNIFQRSFSKLIFAMNILILAMHLLILGMNISIFVLAMNMAWRSGALVRKRLWVRLPPYQLVTASKMAYYRFI